MMRTRTRVLLASTGLTAVLAVGVPAVALADGGSSSSTPSTSSTSSTSCAHPVADYLKAHADLQAELKKIKALPADQRKAERQTYFAAHADEKTGLQQAAQQAKGAFTDRLGSLGDVLAAHPEVGDLLDQLRNAPAGQRAQAAQQFLAQHPDLRAQLKDVRTALRADRAACRTGGK
jgi:hemophore-related protein